MFSYLSSEASLRPSNRDKGTSESLWFLSARSISKYEFQSELYLSRRTRFTGRKARGGDPAKSRRTHHVSRRAKVSVIEQIEELRPKLHTNSLAKPGVLYD